MITNLLDKSMRLYYSIANVHCRPQLPSKQLCNTIHKVLKYQGRLRGFPSWWKTKRELKKWRRRDWILIWQSTWTRWNLKWWVYFVGDILWVFLFYLIFVSFFFFCFYFFPPSLLYRSFINFLKRAMQFLTPQQLLWRQPEDPLGLDLFSIFPNKED